MRARASAHVWITDDTTRTHDSQPGDSGVGLPAVVLHHPQRYQGPCASQPRLAVHCDHACLGITQVEEGLDDVRRGHCAIIEVQIHEMKSGIFKIGPARQHTMSHQHMSQQDRARSRQAGARVGMQLHFACSERTVRECVMQSCSHKYTDSPVICIILIQPNNRSHTPVLEDLKIMFGLK